MLPFKKILCPTDLSDPSFEGFKAAVETAQHFSAELILVHVVSSMPAVAIPDAAPAMDLSLQIQEMVQTAQKEISKLVNTWAKGIRVRPMVVEGNAGLQALFYRQRQMAITEEQLDIVSGYEALESGMP